MRETMRDYLKRRYRIALTGVVVGALVLIMAPGSAVTLVLQIVGAIVFGSALLIATLTRCPKCRELFDRRAIAAMVQNSHKPPERCPHCGVDLNAPRP